MVPLFYKKVDFLKLNRKMTHARKLIYARLEPEYSFKRRLKEMRSLMLGLEALPGSILQLTERSKNVDKNLLIELTGVVE